MTRKPVESPHEVSRLLATGQKGFSPRYFSRRRINAANSILKVVLSGKTGRFKLQGQKSRDRRAMRLEENKGSRTNHRFMDMGAAKECGRLLRLLHDQHPPTLPETSDGGPSQARVSAGSKIRAKGG